MYTRSYYPDGTGRMNLPENYDGCAFTDEGRPPAEDTAKVSFIPEGGGCESCQAGCLNHGHGSGQGSFLSGIFGSEGILGGLNLKLPTIGTEEILIIAMAAFLFFSKWGDKESAVMLLLLLLVN
jgi:hypothetical protein